MSAKARKRGKVSDRRKAQRLSIPIPVKYKLSRKHALLSQTHCSDISGSGIRLKLDEPLVAGDRLKTLLYFPGDKKPVTATSEVIWCRQEKKAKNGKHYFVGVRHLKIDSKDRTRFVFLFCEMMINYFILGQID